MNVLNVMLLFSVCRRVGGPMVNLAFKKPALMSSVYNQDLAVAPSAAVDENTGTELLKDSCSCSAVSDGMPWWMVDLKGQFPIQRVMLTNRGDQERQNYWDRLHNFDIEIFTQNPSSSFSAVPEVCATQGGTSLGPAEMKNFTCPSPITGRYVRVRKKKKLNEQDLLTLCDVKVFGMRQRGCSSSMSFLQKHGKRMTSHNLNIINDVSSAECGVRCYRNAGCEAFNYNIDLLTCELVLDPRFEDVLQKESAWNYYELH